MKRIFLGIDLPPGIKNIIEDLKKVNHLSNLPIKLVEPDNSHIAIKFFGELTDEQISRLQALVGRETQSFKSFEAVIGEALAFPDFVKPQVLVLKVVSVNLSGLAKKLFTAFAELDFFRPEQRAYTPHVTLGRIKEQLSDSQISLMRELKLEAKFLVGAIQLFESKLTEQGSIYTILSSYNLR